MSRCQVTQRIIDATIAIAARHGYGDATVERILAQAGMSRATFYENFADRGDCFLAAYRELFGRFRGHLDLTSSASLREFLTDLLTAVEREPAAARFLLIESLAADKAVRAEHERSLDEAERRLDEYLDGRAHDEPPVEIPARALLGGVLNVLTVRVFQGETPRITRLTGDLLAWIDSYALPDTSAASESSRRRRDVAAWAALGEGLLPHDRVEKVGPRGKLPRGTGALPAGAVADEQRTRIIAAVAGVSRRKGYTAMTVADVAAAASVSREAFYRLFRSKEDAFLAAQAFGLQSSAALTAGKFFGAEGWTDRVWAGSEAFLEYIATHVDLAHVDLVESYAAGEGVIRRSFDNRMAYTLFLEEGYRQRPEAERLPRLCSEAIGGAILELVRSEVVAGRTERLVELLPQMAYLTLAPFVGPPTALALVEEKLAARRRQT